MPVHQDGSCNGLQHYAGLGLDEDGAVAVNLKPSEFPQDVYSKVLEKVLIQMREDLLIPIDASGVDINDNEDEEVAVIDDDNDSDDEQKVEEEVDEEVVVKKPVKKTKTKLTESQKLQVKGKYARMLDGIVDRKVIKQSVMTSVYGVTLTGARAQIQARLEEKYRSNAAMIMTPELEKELFKASNYLAQLTMKSLELVFSKANQIMDWLKECTKLVAKKVCYFLQDLFLLF
jgi:DNA-directed RNA polymerase